MARRTPASAPPTPPADEGAQSVADTPPAEHFATPQEAGRESGFFAWLRGLGVQRQQGWLGGVCGGVAARLGIDPLIVRGIALVLAVVGAPVALLYAAAWFLLPDDRGVIHAQQLGRGRVTRALPGIVAVFLLSFLPITQGFWYAGALYWGDVGWGGSIGRFVWTGVLLVIVIVFVVWLARRSTSEIPTTPATTDDRPDTVPTLPTDAVGADAAGGTDAVGTPGADAASAAALAATASGTAASGTTASVIPEPGAPPAPPADASAEELAAWKASQDAWQKQRAAWAAEQRRSERDRRQAEAQAQAAEAARLARERARIRKLTRPRASAGVVFLVLGVALVAGAIAAFAASQAPDTRGAEWMIGAAVLVLVLGVGTIAVALGRRRSGALGLFSLLAIAALALAVVLPPDRTTLPPGANFGIDTSHDGSYAQLAGYTGLYVPDRDDGTVVIDLWQAAGTVHVDLDPEATLRVELTTDAARQHVSVDQWGEQGDGRYASYSFTGGSGSFTIGEGQPDVVLRVWIGSYAWLNVSSWGGDDAPLALSPAPDEAWRTDADGTLIEPDDPTPTPIPTEGGTTADEGANP